MGCEPQPLYCVHVRFIMTNFFYHVRGIALSVTLLSTNIIYNDVTQEVKYNIIIKK